MKNDESDVMKYKSKRQAFSIVEILIVLAIISIVAGLSFVSGRRQLTKEEENATVASFSQLVSQGATAASSRGIEVVLLRTANNFSLRRSDNNQELDNFDMPSTVVTNLALNGEILRFAPQGWVDVNSLAALPSPVEFTTSDNTYELTVSLIGEVRTEVQ
ncbi:MAG TPA: prepilin-type N-terminal cleavage/methylation domain-containing protein [Trueperaceae bacterium]|nr:prepilin-type N-terminal cleavage/methylation domain-containing protein [Trueperaceae bacterium]